MCVTHADYHDAHNTSSQMTGPDCVSQGDRIEGSENGKKLTFDLERMPLEPSIQTYSAMTLPFWGRSRYFLS
jgi:hypothetical protein